MVNITALTCANSPCRLVPDVTSPTNPCERESLAVQYHVSLVEPPTLLDDLLEDSGRHYHRCCAIIQQVFHDQWLKTLADEIGKEQIRCPQAAVALVQSRVRERLRACRLALRNKAAEMI